MLMSLCKSGTENSKIILVWKKSLGELPILQDLLGIICEKAKNIRTFGAYGLIY